VFDSFSGRDMRTILPEFSRIFSCSEHGAAVHEASILFSSGSRRCPRARCPTGRGEDSGSISSGRDGSRGWSSPGRKPGGMEGDSQNARAALRDGSSSSTMTTSPLFPAQSGSRAAVNEIEVSGTLAVLNRTNELIEKGPRHRRLRTGRPDSTAAVGLRGQARTPSSAVSESTRAPSARGSCARDRQSLTRRYGHVHPRRACDRKVGRQSRSSSIGPSHSSSRGDEVSSRGVLESALPSSAVRGRTPVFAAVDPANRFRYDVRVDRRGGAETDARRHHQLALHPPAR